MAKRFTDTEKYRKTFFRGLPGAYKLFWDFLCLECNHAGIWYVDFQIAQIYLGDDMRVDPETALRLFNQDKKRVQVLAEGRKWFIRTFIEFQYKVSPEQLNPANKVHASILTALLKEGACKPHASPKLGAKDKEKDKDGVKDVRGSMRGGRKFTPPSAEEVTAYAKTLGFDLDGQYFVDRNEATGWVWGKQRQPIKSWQAVVRTWKTNQAKFNQEDSHAGSHDSPGHVDLKTLARSAREAKRDREKDAAGDVHGGLRDHADVQDQSR